VAAEDAAAAAVAVAAEDDPRLRVWPLRDHAWSLSAPSALLDGNIPLRAAQSCVPFVEGNGAGLSLRPPRPIALVRRRGQWLCSDPSVTVVPSREGLALRVETGLAIEPIGAVVECERSFNRSDRRVKIQQTRIRVRTDLALSMHVELDARDDEVALDGPLASLLLLPDAPRWLRADEPCATAMIDRHCAFFDRSYFAEKREGATKRYRERSREALSSLVDPARADVMVLSLTSAASLDERGLALRAECAIDAECFGATTRCHSNAEAIASRAASLRAAIEPLRSLAADDPALLYFAHYAMAHTHGDPRVLVKPSVLLATREDWVLVVDGPRVESLRGVSESAWFHAAPVVLDVHGRLRIRAGEPLGRARVMPRAMVHPQVELR
jgi:hypothetical protein